ncbi:MAG: electron transport complex subunit E [Hydrogenoanaerobacterium sp.]
MNNTKQSNLQVLLNGLLKENPILVLVLGTCPFLATTTTASNAFGMGFAVTAVLLGSNVFISLLKKIIPDAVRIPCYIVIISSFVTVVSFILEAYQRGIYKSLGIFLPLITVNCIILGRAEMFANKNTVAASACDAIGMGLGYTGALLVMSSIREILGNGTWMGITLTANFIEPMAIMKLAPGGFFVFGFLIAVAGKLSKGRQRKTIGCDGCPMASTCGHIGEKREGECK